MTENQRNRWETIKNYPNHLDAALAKSFLEQNGVQVLLADQNMTNLYGGVVPVRLQVPSFQIEEAVKLLTRHQHRSLLNVIENESGE